MEYHEAVNRLERLRHQRPKLGTETTAEILAHLGTTQEDFTAVQVAGSNGKGSTARTLESILAETDLEVGLYTSPDLNGVRERVRISGREISKACVTEFVELVWPFVVDRSVDGEAPTFFEVVTAMAIWKFDRSDVDVAVLEVGIGGRYDATSVVDPAAAAVTTVSLEHTDIIGSSVEEIARDKGTVAPSDAPLVTGTSGEARDVLRESTDLITVGTASSPARTAMGDGGTVTDIPEGNRQEGDLDVLATESEMVSRTESVVSIVGPEWDVETRTPLVGQHQAVNAGIAATLARQVASVSTDAIAAGIRNVHWPGRFEVMDRDPFVVLDGAHNPDACEKLAAVLQRFDYDDLHIVFGAMRDKDHRSVCRSLPAVDGAFLAEPAVGRAAGTDTLTAVFERESDATIQRCESVLDGVEAALRSADQSDCVLVTGSLYVVGEARDRWTRTPRSVRTETTTRARERMANANAPPSQRTAHAESMVARTVRLHVRSGMAEELVERMCSLGGTAVRSGIEATDQHVQVVISGTLAQFRDLVTSLETGDGEAAHVARQLSEAIEDSNESTPAVASAGGNRDHDYPWSDGTAVMGILNVTPDSFFDGGSYATTADAIARAKEMVDAGAALVDVGGESTRPGATPITAEEERARVLPVVDTLADFDVAISVDTRKPSVAEAALDAGASVVNDVTGLADAAMRDLVADRGVPAVCMHSLAAPVDPSSEARYDHVVTDVLDALGERILTAERAGIHRSQLIVDPGVGFGKRAEESFRLLDRLEEFRALGTPVMVGHSRKSMFEDVAGEGSDRFAPTVAATALAAERGANVVRVHDVAANVAAVETAQRTAQDR